MRLAQLHRPLVAASSCGSAAAKSGVALRQLQDGLAALRIGNTNQAVEGRRYASVKSQGAYRIRDSSTIPKNLGAKKTGDTYVIPGNILFKQRGTKWHPGENVGIGRDHTLFSKVTGYVKYYKDPAKHPDRQYIGVVFNKEDKLPYHPHAMRKRKLNMTASIIPEPKIEPEISASGIPNQVVRQGYGRNPHPREERIYKLQKDGSYSYREENWRLGSLIRTEKRKMGSRRVAMKHRRRKTKAIQAEMRRDREDKIARRKEALDEQRAAKQKKFRDYYARKNAEAAAAAAAGGDAAPPKKPEPRAQA
ncbi:ribosomal protein L27 [Pestalotiopsis sp. NC0098]|nr:ribosomal protein L27 [Pestalotiopsis sp. NC0098]KAI4596849.1 54S ribosomal protein L2 mitochondrial [Pestalotiopsis sp. 9143b]